MGISATRSHEESKMPANKAQLLHGVATSQSCAPTASATQKRVLAGVGKPMKEVLWRSSKLNLAKRKAEKAAMMKAANGR